VGFRDLLRLGRRPADVQPTWEVHTEAGEVVVVNAARYPLSGVRCVRVVPLTGGQHHSGSHGWQVALHRDDGDVLVDKAMPDWRPARDLAQRLCDATQLPLDELTQRLFSQVGRYSPKA
jgi:hypothetical protein